MTRKRAPGMMLAVTLLAGCGSAVGMPPAVVTVLGYSIVPRTETPASVPVGTAIPVAFTVTENESDGTSRPASGKVILIDVTSGGGTINGGVTTSMVTGADGSDSLTWVLNGTPGAQSIRAYEPQGPHYLGLTTYANPGPPSSIVLVTLPSTTATVGVPLARQPTFQFVDTYGNATPVGGGAPVDIDIASGGGVLSGWREPVSNLSGVLTFTDLTISGVTGVVTLTFKFFINGNEVDLNSAPITVSP
jgi:hypothetical protein